MADEQAGEAPADDRGGSSERRRGSLDELRDLHGVVREHGAFLLMRSVGEIDGQEAFEGLPARFVSDEEGEAGALWIGDTMHLLRLDALESVRRAAVPDRRPA